MRALRYIIRFFLLLVMLAAITIAGAYFYIRSDSGLDRLAREATTRASSDEMKITLTGLRGDVFGDLKLAEISIADREGIWLTAKNIHVVYSPRALLREQAPLTLLAAEKINVLREPVSTEPAPTTTSGPLIPDIRPYAIYLPQRLQITELAVAEPIAGIEQRVSLNGSGDANSYALKLATIAGIPLSLDATMQPQKEQFATKVAFHEAEGGVVSALLGLPNNIALNLDADISANRAGDITISTATLRAGSFVMDASGTYSISQNMADLSFAANAPDMEIIQALSGMPMSGSAKLALQAKGTPDQLAVTLDASTSRLVVEQHRVENFNLQAQGNLNPSAWGSAQFAVDGTLAAKGSYNGEEVTLTLKGDGKDGSINLPELAANYGNYALSGNASGNGSIAKFELKTALALQTPDGNSQLTLDGTVDSETPRYSGNAKGTFEHQKHRFDFATTLDADETRAKLAPLSLKGPGAELEGSADILIAEQLADAALKLRATDLAPLGQLLGQQLSGAVNADITLAKTSGKQRAEVKATAQKLTLPGLQIARATLDASTTDAKALEGIALTLDATNLTADTTHAASINATAKGGMKQGITLAANSKGTLEKTPWDIILAGKAQQPNEQSYRVELSQLEGTYAKAPIKMANATTLIYSPQQSSLSPLTLQLADGTVQAEGKLTGNSVAGKATISSLALDKLPGANLPEALLNATLDISGTAAAPVLAWNATTNAMLEGMKLDAQAKGGWKSGTLQSTITANSSEATATLNASLPARLTLQPFATDIGNQTTLSGDVKASLPLTMFNTALRPQGHRLGGMIAGNATLGGNLGNPRFNGAFNLTDGRYDHAATGICLRDMRARLSGNPQAVRLEEFSATDSAQNQFTATGGLALSGTPTLSGQAKFDQFKLFCGGMMDGQIDGSIAASGTTDAMNIAGKLELGPLNIQIPGARAGSSIPQVEAEWIRPGERRQKSTPSIIALDIAIAAENQLFIRGRGLDAEFGGNLAITGTATTPTISGQLDKKRGTFTLLDRKLTLDTASVKFDGPMPPSPFLNIVASTKVSTNTINVTLAGSANKPKLTLSSTPTLPQDEVLAQLLFGRQLDRISPFEAVQLAQATRTLAGLDGGGPGIVGSIRDALGLDRLEVGADEESNFSVSTGKYLTDDVYVGVVQGTKPEDRKVVTEITLTPSVSSKTAVDSVGNQSVGVEWKRDY